MRQVIITQHRTYAAIMGHITKVTFVVCLLVLTQPQNTSAQAPPQVTPTGTPDAVQRSGDGPEPSKKDTATTGRTQSPAKTQASPNKKTSGTVDPVTKIQLELEKRRSEVMQIRKRLLEPNAVEKYDRVKFLSIMRAGAGNAADKKVFDASLRYRVLQIANEDQFKKEGELRVRLMRDLKNCGTKIQGKVATRKFREETMAKVVAHCESMLDNQFAVRQNAVILIGQLNVEPGAVRKPPVPYIEAYKPLMAVVNDPKQLPTIKIAAVRGLERIMQLAVLANPIQDKIGDDLLAIGAAGNPAVPWLDQAICETVAHVKTTKDKRTQILLSIIGDKKREWRVRSAAAFAIGRTGSNPRDADLLAYRVVQMFQELALDYNKNPRNMDLPRYAFKGYLAFHRNVDEDKNRKIGLMERAPTVKVKQSFEKLIVPTITIMFNAPGRQLPGGLLNVYSKWLADNAKIDKTAAKQNPGKK